MMAGGKAPGCVIRVPVWEVPSGGCPSEGPTVAGRPEYVEEEAPGSAATETPRSARWPVAGCGSTDSG